MKNIKNINKPTIILMAVALVIGLVMGGLIFGGSREKEGSLEHDHTAEAEEGKVWTCAMHPQIRQDKPGKCPICGMDLTPLGETKFTADNDFTFHMTEAAAALANVQTTIVQPEGKGGKEAVLTGKIEADERRIYEIPAQFQGRLEKLYINFTGEYVSRGKALASIYSPDLITAQQELFEAIPYKESNPAMYRAARNKLKNWKISDSEIDQIEQSGKVKTELIIRAYQAGVVRKRNVAVGDHVKTGDVLFEVVDLSHLWVMFDAYEQHLASIKTGDQVAFTVASLPGKPFKAQVTFIDPFIDPQTRVAKIRAEIANEDGALKPEMFVRGTVKSAVGDVQGGGLLVPQSAVLWTGKRSLVYVKRPDIEDPTFEYREVTLGSLAGDYFVVEDGLSAGEEVVTNGTFSIDAAAQLSGKASMMNPEGGSANTGHHHGDDEMSVSGQNDKTANPAKMEVPASAKAALEKITKTYLKLKDALVNDDFAMAKKELDNVRSSISAVDMSLFKGASHDRWMDIQKELQGYVGTMDKVANIEDMRRQFKPLSMSVIRMTVAFGPFSMPLYIQHCPMADSDKGADWLSLSEEIRNPYFGEKMLKCGEVTKTIQ